MFFWPHVASWSGWSADVAKRGMKGKDMSAHQDLCPTLSRQNYRFATSNGELHDSSFQGWSKDVPWMSFQAPQEFHNWAKGAWCPELPVWQAGKAWLRTWADLWSSPEQVSQQPSTCHNPQTGPCRIRPYLSCKYIKYNCRHRLPTKGVTCKMVLLKRSHPYIIVEND